MTIPVKPTHPPPLFTWNLTQGSLHYIPEHCLVNGGVLEFWWKKPCFKWAKCAERQAPCKWEGTWAYPGQSFKGGAGLDHVPYK